MSSKRRVRRQICSGKVRYDNEQLAIGASSRAYRQWGKWMRPYHCKFCNGWHVGTMKHRRSDAHAKASYIE